MRVLVVYAHPLAISFNAALHAQVLATLGARGHEIDDCDLYAESFDPVLTAEDLLLYNDIPANRQRVASYVDRLLAANALILMYPVWNEGFPAIMKGFLDGKYGRGFGRCRHCRPVTEQSFIKCEENATLFPDRAVLCTIVGVFPNG
jgi:putative NADPH-quinone reductase